MGRENFRAAAIARGRRPPRGSNCPRAPPAARQQLPAGAARRAAAIACGCNPPAN